MVHKIESYGVAVKIEDGFLLSAPLYKDGSYNDDEFATVCKNVDGVDALFLDAVQQQSGWIYSRDYKLDTCL